MSKWKNVPGQLDIKFDEEHPLKVTFPGMPTKGTLEITFLSSGEFDPGFIGGPPEDCRPPDYDEVRVPRENANIWYGENEEEYIELSNEQTEQIFEVYESEINVVDLEFDDLDRGDYDEECE